MTRETAKELLRKTKVIRDNFYPEPIKPEHEDEQKITFEFLSEVINYLENDIDKLSVEKLQEQLNTAKKALAEIINANDNLFLSVHGRGDLDSALDNARKALAAIGENDDNY
ncbi:hypothetical protein QK916_11235 [Lactococcus lactis]|uniref:hypothetical protein n=1 Tax=Lactococcus lactis TaxID=1358 RepID=UPI00325E06DF